MLVVGYGSQEHSLNSVWGGDDCPCTEVAESSCDNQEVADPVTCKDAGTGCDSDADCLQSGDDTVGRIVLSDPKTCVGGTGGNCTNDTGICAFTRQCECEGLIWSKCYTKEKDQKEFDQAVSC